MKQIRTTEVFHRWLASLADVSVVSRIDTRLRRLAEGNPGQHRVLSRGLRELKIDVGPGFRVYYVERGDDMILLLTGGQKSSQRQDIAEAMALIRNLHEEA